MHTYIHTQTHTYITAIQPSIHTYIHTDRDRHIQTETYIHTVSQSDRHPYIHTDKHTV